MVMCCASSWRHGQVTCSAVNLQLRDLRLLDPQLSTSYPSAILARDDALVLNLEFIKVGLELVIGIHVHHRGGCRFRLGAVAFSLVPYADTRHRVGHIRTGLVMRAPASAVAGAKQAAEIEHASVVAVWDDCVGQLCVEAEGPAWTGAQALITREYVLVLNAEEEAVVGFIEELQRRLAPKQPTARMATLAASASLPDLHHVRLRPRPQPATTPCILHWHELWHGSVRIQHIGP